MSKTRTEASQRPVASIASTTRPVAHAGAANLAALAVLARRGAIAELIIAPDGSRSVEIHVTDDCTTHSAQTHCRSPRNRLPYSLFRDARDAGWLVPVDCDNVRWVLSRAARQLLRRQKSAGDGAPVASSRPLPVPAHLPAMPTAPHVDPGESPLDWLRRHKDKSGRPLISATQLEAGERFRSDLWRAEMTPRVTIDWSRIGGGGIGSSQRRPGGSADTNDGTVAAAQRIRRALGAVGPVSAGLLIDVCGHLIGVEEIERRRGWPVRSGKIALQIALSELARHYRLPGTETSEAEIATRLRVWREHAAP